MKTNKSNKKQGLDISGTELERQLDKLPATYPQLAMRTNLPGAKIEVSKQQWKALLTGAAIITEGCYKADRLKASLIYGEKCREYAHPDMPMPKFALTPNEKELLHAILGIISEGGELLEMFIKNKTRGIGVDRVNAIEEGGDILWFCQLLFKSMNGTMEEAMQANILKLAKRFPDGFSEEMALVRDQDGERDVLERAIDVRGEGK